MRLILEKIKRWLKTFMYSIPYAMKGAEDEIFGNVSKGADGSSISCEVSDRRVANHLLKGEVTQEVEELRYRTYKVAEESKKYRYLGNGVAVLQDASAFAPKRTKYTFSQDNYLLCASINEEFKHMNDYGEENYRFKISYSYTPRFKMEQHSVGVDVEIDNENKVILTIMRFSCYPNKYIVSSKPFIRSFEEYIANGAKGEFIDCMSSLSFTTYKANGEDDLVSYVFMNPTFKGITLDERKGEYLLTYSWETFIRSPLELSDKYYSKSMDEKYKNKERKDASVSLVSSNRKRYCSACGKEISLYDGDILKYGDMDVLCNDCRKKKINDDYNRN